MQFSNSAPGNMWRLKTFQQVLVQEEEEGTGMCCKTAHTFGYAMSHGLYRTMDSYESERINTYSDDWKGNSLF